MAVGAKKQCVCCTSTIAASNFYSSKNPLFGDNKVPICKACIQENMSEDDISTVKRILRLIDKPFIWSRWKNAVDSDKETFGWYMREINSFLPDATYDDSVDNRDSKEKIKTDKDFDGVEEIETEEGETIVVTPEIKLKFGVGYTNLEYLDMEKFYRDMMTSHVIKTPQHKKLLVRLCQLNTKADHSIDDPTAFDKYMKQYETIMKSAGFRPADSVAGNEASGIRTFGQVFEEIERDGFIEPTPIMERQDIIDRTIFYIENNFRQLLNVEKLAEPPADTPKTAGEEVEV